MSSRRRFLGNSALALGGAAAYQVAGIGSPLFAAANDGRVITKGYALSSKDGKFTPYEFKRHPDWRQLELPANDN